MSIDLTIPTCRYGSRRLASDSGADVTYARAHSRQVCSVCWCSSHHGCSVDGPTIIWPRRGCSRPGP
jgi:hypothetical protein